MAKRGFLFPEALHSLSIVGKPEQVNGNFQEVMAEGPNPKKKHLLHRLVKKVLIHSRQTIEIWYALPNSRRFEDCNTGSPNVPVY
jgi:urate oxidase